MHNETKMRTKKKHGKRKNGGDIRKAKKKSAHSRFNIFIQTIPIINKLFPLYEQREQFQVESS